VDDQLREKDLMPKSISQSKECVMQTNTYLFFNGNCEEALKFYEKALGAKIEAMVPHAGTPAEGQVPAAWKNKIIHARIKLGDQSLMASDTPPDHAQTPQGFRVNLSFQDPAEAERIYGALSKGGTVNMELQETFWAKKFGTLTDRFGTPWMINCYKAPA
jgi:PhnB protein